MWTFAIGMILGGGLGAGLAYVFGKKSAKDAQTIAQQISASMLTQQTDHILKLSESKLEGKKEVIDGTLKSMQDGMGRIETMLKSVGEGNVQVGTRLNEAAKTILDLSNTTKGIREALASNSSRGQWGERMAEDVLRLSGMIEGINFIKQAKLESSGSKPDFTFLLPNNLKLNMDVKFPFNNYQQYAEAQNEKDREEYKKKFLKDVRLRLKEVQTRDYINPEDHTVDYVLLFVPNEQIFSFINEIDRELIDEAMRGRTILCSPLSLYAILAVIRQSIDNFNMESKSQEMLSHFGAFKTQWEKFKEQMQRVKSQFETTHKSYEELTGARERQLDRQLTKIEEIRQQRGIDIAEIEDTADRVTRKHLVSTHNE